MSLMTRIRDLKARAKFEIGKRTGNRRLAAEARTDAAEARLLDTHDQIKATAQEIRDTYGKRS